MVIKAKKAQEFNWTTLIVIVLLLGVAVIYFLFFTEIGGKLRGVSGALPGDLGVAVPACQTWSKSDSTAVSFCEFKLMTTWSSAKEWLNCQGVYDESIKFINVSAIGYRRDAISCSSDSVVNKCKEFLTNTLYSSSVIVNGKPCKLIFSDNGVTCGGLGGDLKATGDCVNSQADISDWLAPSTTKQKCCYPTLKKCTGKSTITCDKASSAQTTSAVCSQMGCDFDTATSLCKGSNVVDCSKVDSSSCALYGCDAAVAVNS